MRFAAGSRLGPYEIRAPLGVGGMGEVYRAHDDRLGRDVAIKVLPAEFATSPDRLRRFRAEARTVAAFNHPNIVVIHSVEEADGVPFLTMELVEGRSLREVVVPGGLPLARVLDLAIPIAEALAAAHALNIVHRDLKPANVMVTADGRVKVLDFGLARMVGLPSDDTQAVTQTHVAGMSGIVGTMPYMSPEQVRGRPLDARTDLFSLGVLIYELLTGRRAFLGPDQGTLSRAILSESPPPLAQLRPELPAEVAWIVSRCLEKDPLRRYATARELADDLSRLRAAESGGPPAASDDGAIAVMPFSSPGGGEEAGLFAEGMTEDVIAQLCRVRTLKVISRASVAGYKDRELDLAAIASRLRVSRVLTGSVRRSGDRVRIVAQLIDVRSERVVWTETYDRQLTDVFAVQSDVALSLAEAMQANLTSEERRRLQHDPTRNVGAYVEYLRGRRAFYRFNEISILESIPYFERAIAIDPGFALAYVGLTLAYTELGENGRLSRQEGGARARAISDQALVLAPEMGEAWCASAMARMVYELDWVGAEAAFRRAIELSPSHAESHVYFGRMCVNLGRFDEGIAHQQRAFELDPLNQRTDLATSLIRAGRYEEAARAAIRSSELEPGDPRPKATHGWALFRLGRRDEAVAELERAVALSSDDEMWLAQLGMLYGLVGREAEARQVLARLTESSRPVQASPYRLAYVHTGLGDYERAMDCLEEAVRLGVGPLSGIRSSFLFEPLRPHPRFQALMARMGLG